MKSIVARLLLSSTVFLLPLSLPAGSAGAQTIDDRLELTAHDPETGEALPTQDGKASIDGTPGDGVRDFFNYRVFIYPAFPMDYPGPLDEHAGPLSIEVRAYDDDQQYYENDQQYNVVGTDVIDTFEIHEGRALIRGRIDLSSDTEFGQMLRYLGRVDLPDGRAATFEHDVTVGCLCPRAGSWTATNYPGTMVCTGPHFNRTLPLPGSTQTATLLVDYGCQAMDITNFDDEYAEVTMQRIPGECGYEGYARGVPMESRFTFDVQNEEFLIGKLRMQIEQQGTTCIISRDFEVRFND